MALSRPCLTCGTPTYDTRCRLCEAARRGTTSQRGYGLEHITLRRYWAPEVATGSINCARCGKAILPQDPWDLGHSDVDRREYAGPEHQRCNRATNRTS